MSAFTQNELEYLGERRPERLARIATVGAEAIEGERSLIRVHPERIVSWGLESEALGERHSHAVTASNRG